LKIVYVIRQLGSTGGVERRLDQLYSSDLLNEFEIQIFSFLGILETYKKNFQIFLPFRYFARLFKLMKYLKKEKPDLIHVFDLESLLYTSLSLKILGNSKIKIIGSYGAEKVYNLKIQKLLSFRLFYPTFFICNSNNGRISLLNVTKGKVTVKVIFNGFTPDHTKLSSKHPEWYNPGIRYVGLITKFDDYKKGIRVFDIIDNIPITENICFVVIGTGSDFSLAQKKLDENPIYKNRIILLGIIRDAWTMIPWFDMGLLVSESEGFPTVLIEFLAMKKPILTTNCGEVKLILNNGKAGIIEEKFNAFKFAEHILNNCFRGNSNEIGYKWYRDNFMLDRMVRDYKEVYNSITCAE
jgi:glycosyltransferase involved in cell wall biosynthesis